MFLKMIQAALNLVENEIEKQNIITLLEEITKSCPVEDRENILKVLRYLSEPNKVYSPETLHQLNRLTFGNVSFLLINAMLLTVKLNKPYSLSGTYSVLEDKRFVESEVPGILYEVVSDTYLDDKLLECYGFKKEQLVRSLVGTMHMISIKESQDAVIKSSPLNHIKIWFAKPGTHPLGGVLNELRLIRQSEACLNKKERFTLLTKFNTKQDQEYIISFCNRHGINLLLTNDIKNELDGKEWLDKSIQLNLFNIAMLELSDPAGHPVIASDIFRLLSPVLLLGIYSDIDNKIQQKEAEPVVLPDLLFKFNLEPKDSMFSVRDVNNDVIHATNPEHHILRTYRQKIYEYYTNPSFICNLPLDYVPFDYKGTGTLIDSEGIIAIKRFSEKYFQQRRHTQIESDVLEFREQLKLTYPQYFEMFFYIYVKHISGPNCMIDSLFENKNIKQLNEMFKYCFSTSPITATAENSDQSTDLSWLQKGADKLENKNRKIIDSASLIQRFWRTHVNLKRQSEVDEVVGSFVMGG